MYFYKSSIKKKRLDLGCDKEMIEQTDYEQPHKQKINGPKLSSGENPICENTNTRQ